MKGLAITRHGFLVMGSDRLKARGSRWRHSAGLSFIEAKIEAKALSWTLAVRRPPLRRQMMTSPWRMISTTLLAGALASTDMILPAIAENSMVPIQEILEAHNRYRADVRVPPLTWSNTLANHAQQWANHLASMGGTLQHSRNAERPNEGENLWRGTSHRFSFAQMVDS